jgi:HPt (histidine-containing phosphotransfer) domain-containing protein
VIKKAQKQKQKMEKIPAKNTEPETEALFDVFLLDVKKVLPIIESIFTNIDYATDEDLKMFTINVHAIKSALANIGENTTSKLAFDLEKAGKSKNKNIIKVHTQALIDELNSIIEKIESNKKLPKADVDEDLGYLREQLQVIYKACTAYDERPVNTALEALKKLSWKKNTQVLIDKISEVFLYGDFESAAAIAKEFLENPE